MWYNINGKICYVDDKVLMHYGVKGMKWGVRKRIEDVYNATRRVQSRIGQAQNTYNRLANTARNSKLAKTVKSAYSGKKSTKPSENLTPEEARKQKAKRAVKIGAAVAATALATYGAYKVNKFVREANVQHHANIIAKTLEPLYQQGQAFGTGPLATLESRNSARWGTATVAKGFAKNDSFGTALKNVTKDAIKRKTGRY